MMEQIGATGLGMALGAYNDARQTKQQEKLQRIQIKGQKELGIFNREEALKQWQDTSYNEQRKQMEKAGINVGLMYGSAGSGGTTQGAGAGSTGAASATQAGGNEIGMGLQMQLLKAQKENIEADTANKKADTTNKPVQGANIAAGTDAIRQGINNAKIEAELMEWDKKLKEIETNVSKQTEQDRILQIKLASQSLVARIQKEQAEGKVEAATADAKIQQIQTASVEQGLRIALQKIGITEAGARINKIANDIVVANQQLKNEGIKIGQTQQDLDRKTQELILQTIKTNFETSAPKEWKQYTEVFKDVAEILSKAVGAAAGAM